MGFSIGKLPFTYLGIPIFKGKPLQPIADRIKSKLAAWKASLLSIAGRVQLVKTIIHGMMLYSFLGDTWPISLIKKVDRWIRNYIWSGDVDHKKLVRISRHKACRPEDEGGLGLRSLRDVNKAAALKLCWDFTQSSNHWACLLRARVLRNNSHIPGHVSSSVWAGLKNCYLDVQDNLSWLIGSGDAVRFWLDNWLSKPLVSLLNFQSSVHKHLNSKVGDFISNGKWRILAVLLHQFPVMNSELANICIPTVPCDDQLIWKDSDSGELSFKDAYLYYKLIGQALHWAKLIWHNAIPVQISSFLENPSWQIAYR